MSGKGWSVGRVAEVAGFARAATRGRDERISAHVLVDPEAPRQLVLAVRDSNVFDGAHLIPVNRYRQVAAALEPALR